MNAGSILFILFAIISVSLFTLVVINNVKAIKGKLEVNKNYLIRNLIFTAGFAVSFTAMLYFIYIWNNITPKAHEVLATIFGGLFFGAFGLVSLSSFMLHYWGKLKDKVLDKRLFVILCVAFPLAVVFLFLTTDGFASYLTYPLVNGFNFSHGFVTPDSSYSPNVAFYALCILSGAIYVYLLCDHKFYLEYGKHGILESTFLVAFPAGIIGARIFYVIGNYSTEFAGRGFLAMLDLTKGGLTILGGALTGIVVGVSWFLWRLKQYNIWLGIDIIVPTILLAQGIGRWGNFFNCEVHGGLVPEAYWKWLPTFIFENAHYSSTQGWAPSGYLYAPLFLVEGIANFLGYFVLAHVFGNKLRKQTELGDVAFGYLIWYGATRTFMEPLRDGSFNMGADGYWSWIWSLAFVVGGFLLIIANHVIRHLSRSKRGILKPTNDWFKHGLLATLIILVFSLSLVLTGVFFMINNTFTPSITFNGFNIGLIFLVFGASFLLSMSIPLLYVVSAKKVNKVVLDE